MTDIIERLKLDHQRLHSVLEALENALTEADAGDEAARDRLFCMLDYLMEYPHSIHHPIEDAVFKRLLEADLDGDQLKIVQENLAQHTLLEAETRRLFDAVDEDDTQLDALADLVSAYIQHQLVHMQHEENALFPLAGEVFTPADWAAMDEHYQALHDPLFDAAEARFSALYECLGVDPAHAVYKRGAAATARFLAATGTEGGADR